MKKRLWLLLIAMVLIWKAGDVFLKAAPSYDELLEKNWGITLPWQAQLTEVYASDSGSSFHGDGVRCHVFSYKYEHYVDLMLAWAPMEQKTIFYPTSSAASEAWLDEIHVPKEWRPEYRKCCSWHQSQPDNSEILIFWDNGANLLYVIEKFL